MKQIENLPSHLDPNDPLVRQAHQGKGWGAQDQARYDAAIGKKMKGSDVGDSGANRQEKLANMDQHIKDGGYLGGVAQRKYNHMQAKERTNNYQANKTDIKNTQTQNVNQDNDINTDVKGNNNTVINEQDNSIRNYGGDNRSFVYNSQGSGYSDTPVSAATMSGFYGPNDSAAANASFNDRYTTMNRDNQKRYAGDAMKTYAKFGNIDARKYTDESMENAINRSTQYSFDRADRQTGHVFGDIWNSNYITEEWKMPSAPKAIESNAKDIAEDAKKDIEDM